MAPWIKSAAVAALLPLLPGVVTAQDASLVFSKASNNTLLWGPYRPNLYFGVRPRIPKSVMTGLLWGAVDDYQTIPASPLPLFDFCYCACPLTRVTPCRHPLHVRTE